MKKQTFSLLATIPCNVPQTFGIETWLYGDYAKIDLYARKLDTLCLCNVSQEMLNNLINGTASRVVTLNFFFIILWFPSGSVIVN